MNLRTATFGAALACTFVPLVAQTGEGRVDTSADEWELTCGCGKANVIRQRLLAGELVNEPQGAAYGSREALTDTDVLSNVLDVEIIPSTSTITGSNTMTVRSRVNNLTQFTFVLRFQYTVNTTGTLNSVLLNGATTAIATAPTNNATYQRHVPLDRAYNAGETFTIKVSYSGVPVNVGLGAVNFQPQDNVTGNPTIFETLSEPFYSGSWWPCKDGDVNSIGDNSDKSTMDMSVTAPSSMRTVSNGLLQSVTPVGDGTRTKYRWVTNYPTATYLFCIASTQYNTYPATYTYPLPGGGTGSMPVEFNLYPVDDTAAHRNVWALCTTMMAAYRPYYGEYPFVNEKYGIYEFNFSGGQEHQTNTGEGVFDEGVTSHELGHQWWGDNITCKYWADVWLNEGFATYTEALWLEHKPGSTGLPAYLAAMQARKPNPTSDSVYVYVYNDVNRMFSSNYTYKKGAWALHQLRHVVGDATFYQILQTYRSLFQGGGATTDDFANVAASVSGKNLTQFFQEWVYGIGAPVYTVGRQATSINGQNYLRVSLTQSQDSTWPGAGAPAGVFAMPIDLRVDSISGSATSTLNNTARTQWFVIPTTAAATGVALDEFGWVLTSGATNNAGTYAAGPPKVVQASPGPNASFAPGNPVTSASIWFSEAVNATSGAFSVTGPSGPVSFLFSQSSPGVTLQFGSALPAGTYTVTVQPTVTAAAGGAALDGEVPGTALVGQASLPSGDGIAGGAASWTFTVQAPPACGSADFNCDGDTGTDLDIEAFFACIAGDCPPPPCNGSADFNGDGDIGTDADIEAFFRVLAGGTC